MCAITFELHAAFPCRQNRTDFVPGPDGDAAQTASCTSQFVPELETERRVSFSGDVQSSDCRSLAGNRHRETGALAVVGAEGVVWSSSSYAAGNHNAGNLWFHSGNVNPLNNSNRANAFSVRCVQHLLGLFFNYIRIGTCGTTCGPE